METPPKSEIILYQTEDNQTRGLDGQTAWLTQAQMAELFQRERSVITKHLRNIFEEGELAPPTGKLTRPFITTWTPLSPWATA